MSEVRRFGHYECDYCERKWTSAHTFCDRGSFVSKYPQNCQNCGIEVLAHRVDPLKRKRPQGDDASKKHRQDLCHRCKDKLYPCSDSLSDRKSVV